MRCLSLDSRLERWFGLVKIPTGNLWVVQSLIIIKNGVLEKLKVLAKTKNIKNKDKLWLVCSNGKVFYIADTQQDAAKIAAMEKADTVIEVTVKTIYDKDCSGNKDMH